MSKKYIKMDDTYISSINKLVSYIMIEAELQRGLIKAANENVITNNYKNVYFTHMSKETKQKI